MFVFQSVMALLVAAFVFKSFFQPPLDFFASLFSSASELHLLLYLTVFGFYGKALEDALGSKWFAATYLSGALVGNLLPAAALFGFTATAPGAGAGIMALVGTIIALQPLAWVVAVYFPLPAFAAGAFFIVVKFLLDQSLDVLPLLIGIAFGYVVKESQEQKPPPQAQPPWQRR